MLASKNYIAVVMVFLFMVKFFAIEANGLQLFFADSSTSFVNTHCEKRKHFLQKKEVAHISASDASSIEVISLKGQCSPQFQIASERWDIPVRAGNFSFDDFLTANLSYLFLDMVSPPPQFA